MAGTRCHRCGRAGENGTLDWSTTFRDGVAESLCVRCTRAHVRDIESKLDEAWWTTPTRPVLVVEDDDNTRLLIRMSLESAGYVVDVASTGEDALAMLDGGLRPAVIVADVGLPGSVDGWQVRDRAQLAETAPPVILISAHWTSEDEARAAADFLAKPFDMDVLIDLVDRRSTDQAGAGLA